MTNQEMYDEFLNDQFNPGHPDFDHFMRWREVKALETIAAGFASVQAPFLRTLLDAAIFGSYPSSAPSANPLLQTKQPWMEPVDGPR